MGQHTGTATLVPEIDAAPRSPAIEGMPSLFADRGSRAEAIAQPEAETSLAEPDVDVDGRMLLPHNAHIQLPTVSLVVPTRNEADNVEELVRRVDRALPNIPIEIIFVDDSNDDTPEAIETLRGRFRPEIVLVHRPPEQRGDGLGGAVVRGLQMARSSWVCVMDADLQHPPELLPHLLEATNCGAIDLVVASRYCHGGDAGTFGHLRATVSQSSTQVARVMFPNRLRDVTDPMSGFFLIRREAINLEILRPRGFKILLEIIARNPRLRTFEVPFTFGMRHAGDSKASLREGYRYLQLLLNLRFGEGVLRLAKFGLVGITGLIVNALVLAFATELLGIFYLTSAVIATQGSTLWNFALSETWVFSNAHSPRGRPRRLAMFLIMNNVALLLRAPMIVILTTTFGFHYLASNLISLVTLLVLRYGIADHIIWASARDTSGVELTDGAAVHAPFSVKW